MSDYCQKQLVLVVHELTAIEVALDGVLAPGSDAASGRQEVLDPAKSTERLFLLAAEADWLRSRLLAAFGASDVASGCREA